MPSERRARTTEAIRILGTALGVSRRSLLVKLSAGLSIAAANPALAISNTSTPATPAGTSTPGRCFRHMAQSLSLLQQRP
jgi:hypothetical protein